ncbi:pyoverdine signaling pathway anti-sigma factor FpvR [Sessilibacter sp. MAH1]
MNTDPDLYEQALDTASEWLVRLRSENVSEQDKIAFSTWLNTSPSHIHAFDEITDLWRLTGQIDDELLASIEQAKPKVESYSSHYQCSDGSIFKRLSIWATGLALVCLCAVVSVNWYQSQTLNPSVEYQTQAGDLLEVNLPDGSIVHLNTRSKIIVTFTAKQRLVQLVDGEAYFEVAKDPQRPFVVETTRGTVTAVGTAFNVYKQKSSDTVTVTEGIVRVKQHKGATTPYPESKFVSANQEVKLNSNGLREADAALMKRSVEWLTQTITFQNTPLGEAIEEINRYLDTPVYFSQAKLAALHVSGTFATATPTSTLTAILESFNLAVTESGEIYQ